MINLKKFTQIILKGLLNLFLMGFPIALVLILGEKFSLFLNLLTIGCLFLLSGVLVHVTNNDYEGCKTLFYALIGASFAAGLKALAYPGHAVVIIMTTIFVVIIVDLIKSDEILGLKFIRKFKFRLRLLGKIIMVATVFFIISLVIANFGSQKIWIPIVVALLMTTVLTHNDIYLDFKGRGIRSYEILGILVLTGLTSTVIQFGQVELFLGIQIWQATVAIVAKAIIILIVILILKKRKRKAEILKFRRDNEFRQRQLEQESASRLAEEKKKEAEKLAELRELVNKPNNEITVNDVVRVYAENKAEAVDLFLRSDINAKMMMELITVSNQKKQIVWKHGLIPMLWLFFRIAKKNFNDEELERVLFIVKEVKNSISNLKQSKVSYKGEDELLDSLKAIELAVSANNK